MCHSRSWACTNPWAKNASGADAAMMWGIPSGSRQTSAPARRPGRRTVPSRSGRADARSARVRSIVCRRRKSRASPQQRSRASRACPGPVPGGTPRTHPEHAPDLQPAAHAGTACAARARARWGDLTHVGGGRRMMGRPMLRRLALACAVLMLAGAVWLTVPATAQAPAGTIKIGLLYDHTGPFAEGGSLNSWRGAKMIIDYVNEHGG